MIQLDIKKAFDSLNWGFLFQWLEKLKFPEKFLGWIRRCVEGSTFCLSVNGNYSETFKGKRGVKQGDPLSPLLFVIGMEYLSRMLSLAFKNKEIEYHHRSALAGVHSLLFADDLLIFCRATEKSMMGVKSLLKKFYLTTGLQVSEAKSEVFFSAMSEVDKTMLADVLSITQGALPVQYLGVPISSSIWTRETCANLVSKVAERLHTWDSRHLPHSGRLHLINSVLLSITNYWVSIFKLPESIHQDIKQLCGDFLWEKERGVKKLVPIAWDTLCVAKKLGGMGLRDPSLWNEAALSKLVWDVCQKKDVLWIKWIQAYYLKGVDFEDYRPHNIKSWWFSWIWKVLVKLKERLLLQLPKCVNAKGEFKVRAAYDYLKGATRVDGMATTVWHSHLLPQHSFFLWMMLRGRLSTISRLHSLGMLPTVRNQCCMCSTGSVESIQHLFLTCEFARELQKSLNLPREGNMRGFKRWIRGAGKRRKSRQFVLTVSYVYQIWMERNRRVFQSRKYNVEAVKQIVLEVCHHNYSSLLDAL